MNPNSYQQLVETTRDMLDRLGSGQISLAPQVMNKDASAYTDRDCFEREKETLFRRLPLMLAASCELPGDGDYKALEVIDIPVLLTREKGGRVRAFLNSCTHRGSALASGKGCAHRFTCPYHGWTFRNDGRLIGISSQAQFGAADKAKLALVEFPVYESAGLIWVVLDPKSGLDIEAFLSGFDGLLTGYDLRNWQFYEQVSLAGANWKLAFDAHLEFYHLPVLHRKTFGADISNLAQYYFQGPHQRLGLMSANPLIPEQAAFLQLGEVDEAEWDVATMMFGEWILFPNVSINCYPSGVQVMVISQVFPGRSVEESFTVQTYLVERTPTDAEREEVDTVVQFIQKVVREEDLPMSRKQQKALSSGLLPSVYLGRNEEGLQRYYAWRDRVMASSDEGLNELFLRATKTPF
ncbi:MAG: aromatic ring-hydroxylating dioxygenase subunit alpha [Gammaproteobacteria bacterium]|nr:aromatic ring-hydroxylating dioxygenase subunit alpha [Gammaproteobacteria bacterium]